MQVNEALAHPYLEEGRLRYHFCMCMCCSPSARGGRNYTSDFEPLSKKPFDNSWEKRLSSVQKMKGINVFRIHNLNFKLIEIF